MVTDNNILFSYQVITEYNYVNADFKTTNSEEIFVCYNLTDNQIIDCYTPSNYYDISIRGEISQTSIKNNKFTTSNEIKARKNNLITDINNTFEHETTNTDSKKSPAKAVKSINNTAVVNYARANYNKASPARGKSTVPYYDFSTISGSYNCTNFVSHALLAGGANTNDPGGNGISGSGWYFRSINNRSSSWSGVTNLYNYLVNNTKANTADGKWIYITDLQTDKKYKNKLGTDKIHIDEDAQQNIFSPVLINQYEEKYENWFDTGYLISETVVIKKESYLYLRAKSDWSMESLQLSECDIKTNKEMKTINIFDI